MKPEQEHSYIFIGELAIALHSKKIVISLTSLNAIFADKGIAYKSNRGCSNAVKAAYHYWKTKDNVIHHAIAHNFVDKTGKPAWMKYEE